MPFFLRIGNTQMSDQTRTVEELAEEFKALKADADAIRQKMKDLARQIEQRTGSKPPGTSSHEMDTPKE
jgi:uncharacterized coiled-coil DUF342 family protein